MDTFSSSISRANRAHWDQDALRYHQEHDEYLQDFYWCPEHVAESEVRFLGELKGRNVLEIGCGSASCARWVSTQDPYLVTGFDLSRNMLAQSRTREISLAQADALHLPYRNEAFDVCFSSFGAFPFIRDIDQALGETARVLKAGGRFVFSVNHPMRWIFPDDPGPEGLVASISYFDRTYEEYDDTGQLVYAEYHRTIGDWFRELNRAGFQITAVEEPEWPADLNQSWGQWSPLRGKVFPGSIIFRTVKPKN